MSYLSLRGTDQILRFQGRAPDRYQKLSLSDQERGRDNAKDDGLIRDRLEISFELSSKGRLLYDSSKRYFLFLNILDKKHNDTK